MRLFYTLIASGFLILTEIPAEQHPPPAPPPAPQQAVATTERVNVPGEYLVSPYAVSDFSIDQAGVGYLASFPGAYLGISGNSFPIQSNVEHFEARTPPEVQGVRLQDGPELQPVELKETPTPFVQPTTSAQSIAFAKTTTVDGALATYRQQSALPISGFAMYYNPYVMQEVMNNRLAMGHVSTCSECIGSVALLRAGDLNRRVWLQWSDGVVEGPFLVVDVAATQHVASLLARNWVVDVDNYTAVRRRMAGPVWVTVWGAPPTGSQQELPPFAPLYSTLPTAVPIAAQATLPVATPESWPTALPAIYSTPLATAAATGAGFPANAPTPTITPLPAIYATPIATAAVLLATFPQDTPIPTITPLPALNASPASSGAVIQSAPPTATPMPPVVSQPTFTSTPTATAMPMATTAPATTNVVIQQGFPPDTPVPTMTPLPAINPLPSPAP